MTTNHQHDLGPAGASTGPAPQETTATTQGPATQGSASQGAVAKDKAREAAGTAADETKHVAGVAQDEVRQVAAEASQQLRGLVDEATQQVTEQTSVQKSRLAGTVRSFGDDLQSMHQQGDSSGLAAQVVQQVSEQARSLASSLEDREPADLLDDVRRFARERPGTFLLGALAAGVVAGRLARGAKGARDGSTTTTGSDRTAAAPRSVGRTPGAPVPPSPVTAPVVDVRAPLDDGDAGPSYLGTETPVATPPGHVTDPYLDGPGSGVGRG